MLGSSNSKFWEKVMHQERVGKFVTSQSIDTLTTA